MSFSAIKKAMKRLWPYVLENKWWAVGLMLAITAREAAELMLPQIYKRVIEAFQSFSTGTFTAEQLQERGAELTQNFITLQVLIVIFFIIQFTLINRFEVRVLAQAGIDFVDRVLNLSFRFHTNRKSGKLSKEFARGIQGVESLFDVFFFNFYRLIFQFIVIFIVFATIDYRLSLIMAALVIVFCAIVFGLAVRLQRLREKSNDEDDAGAGSVIDALMNAELVKYYQQEDVESRKYKESRKKWKKIKLKEWDSWTILGATQNGLLGVSMTFILWVLIQRILGDSVNPSTVIVVVAYCTSLATMLWDVQWNMRRLVEGVTDTNKMFSYFDEKAEIVDAKDAEPLKAKTGHIVFQDVEFAYNEQRVVLKGLSLDIPGGSSLALVGPSGVGKSTIIKLLYRFYDPSTGNIFIDGHSITRVTQNSLRRQLSIVPQETSLFNQSIGYNIGYGHPDATQEDIERVAKLAHIHDFVMSLPKKYDTMVGERGIKLSGGEKQRISIARALLRDTPIVILDEPTSSLDSASEQEIQAALKNLMENRTVVVIAHRLSTIMNSDKIAVINKGVVAETGTHDELLAAGGIYNHLWELQAGGYIPDVDVNDIDQAPEESEGGDEAADSASEIEEK